MPLVVGVSVFALTVLVAGCSFGKDERPTVSLDGKAVVTDALDGDLDDTWSCSSLRLAAPRVPHGRFRPAPIAAIIEATGQTCDQALTDVKVGQTREDLVARLGAPDSSQSNCLLFGWWPSSESSTDGARICFSDGKVKSVGIAMHG